MKKNIQKILNNNHLLALLSTGASTLFSGVGLLLLVRTYPKQDIGQWILFSSGLELLEMVRTGLLFTALVKFLSGNKIKNDRENLIGSTWVLCFLATFVLTGFSYIIFYLFKAVFIEKGFLLFFKFFSLPFITLLPFSVSVSIAISQQNFKKILFIKMGRTFPPCLFLCLNYFIFRFSISRTVLIHILSSLPVVIYCLVSGSSGIQYILKTSKKGIKKIINFGKYTVFTLLAANLLRSSDVYLIGLFLSDVDVANYGIPMKIVMIIESILFSIYDVAIPAISKEANKNNLPGIKKLFYRYTFLVTVSLSGVVILFILFGKLLLYIFSGAGFLETPEVFCVLVVLILSFLLHPLDRFSGITLDSMNKPDKNLFKVIIMVSVNIIGDILVILFFRSIVPVAFITLLNLLAGAVVGLYYLKQFTGINFADFLVNIKKDINVILKKTGRIFKIKKS